MYFFFPLTRTQAPLVAHVHSCGKLNNLVVYDDEPTSPAMRDESGDNSDHPQSRLYQGEARPHGHAAGRARENGHGQGTSSHQPGEAKACSTGETETEPKQSADPQFSASGADEAEQVEKAQQAAEEDGQDNVLQDLDFGEDDIMGEEGQAAGWFTDRRGGTDAGAESPQREMPDGVSAGAQPAASAPAAGANVTEAKETTQQGDK
jgi:hypothetical protein